MRSHTRADLSAPNIAVVMIHGVADQKHRETVHAGVDLLQCVAHAGIDKVTYDEFEQEALRIDVSPLPPAGGLAANSVEGQFMQERTAGYEPDGPDSVYETTCFTTVRKVNGEDPRNVHLYELYWADLSRPSSGIWQWIIELYELTFLVAFMGSQALRAMLCRSTGCDWNHSFNGSWEGIRRPFFLALFFHAQRLAKFLLAYILPLCNLALVGMGLTLLIVRLPEGLRAYVAAAVPAAAMLGLFLWLSSVWPRAGRHHLGMLVAALVSAFATGASLYWWFKREFLNYLLLVLALEAAIVVWAVIMLGINYWAHRLECGVSPVAKGVQQQQPVRPRRRPSTIMFFWAFALIIQSLSLGTLIYQWRATGADLKTLARLEVLRDSGLARVPPPQSKERPIYEAFFKERLHLLKQTSWRHSGRLIHNTVAGVFKVTDEELKAAGEGAPTQKLTAPKSLPLDWFIDRTLVAAEWLALWTRIGWYGLFALLLLMGTMGFFHFLTTKRMHSKAQWQAWRRASYTALISICIPALLMMVLNIGVWRAVVNFLPLAAGQVPESRDSVSPEFRIFDRNPTCECTDDVQENLLAATTHFTIKPWLICESEEVEGAQPCTRYHTWQWFWRLLQCFIPEDWRQHHDTPHDQALKPPIREKRPAAEAIMDQVDYDAQFVPLTLLLLAGCMLVLLWGLSRSIAAESPARARALAEAARKLAFEKKNGRNDETATSCLDDPAHIHGITLNTAFTWLRYMGLLAVWSVCIAILVHLWMIYRASFGYEEGIYSLHDVVHSVLPEWSRNAMIRVGRSDELPAVSVKLLGLAVIALIAARANGTALGVGLSAVLDIALDVINWMREGPLDRPPRARICARFYSLLQHIGQMKFHGERPYDAVVIVAHSQGTVIAAETLRYLHLGGELWSSPSSKKEPETVEPGHLPRRRFSPPFQPGTALRLFTMGSPLRQLYARRFPHLYHWVVPDGHVQTGSTAEAAGRRPTPDPAELGLSTWWNAYRSGDYVGRGMWWSDFESLEKEPSSLADPDAKKRPFKLRLKHWWQERKRHHETLSALNRKRFASEDIPPASLPETADFCIGAGGHTHYWDETAEAIAYSLDRLITGPATPPEATISSLPAVEK